MSYQKETICVQGGWQPGNGEPRVLPIYQSTTFKYSTSEEMGKLFDLEKDGYFYSRLQNPTNDVVAQKICDLEGGYAGMLTSSGQAANFFAIINICSAGDHVISSATIYGGTSNLLTVTLKRFGIETTLVDPDLPEEELAKELMGTYSMYGGTRETVTLEMSVSLINVLIDRFGDSVHVNRVSDDKFTVKLDIQVSPTFWGWLFQFGADARVTAPEWVVNEAKKKLSEISAMYD